MARRKQRGVTVREADADPAAAAGRTPTALIVLGFCVGLVFWASAAALMFLSILSEPSSEKRSLYIVIAATLLGFLLRVVVQAFSMTVRVPVQLQ